MNGSRFQSLSAAGSAPSWAPSQNSTSGPLHRVSIRHLQELTVGTLHGENPRQPQDDDFLGQMPLKAYTGCSVGPELHGTGADIIILRGRFARVYVRVMATSLDTSVGMLGLQVRASAETSKSRTEINTAFQWTADR